MFSGEAEVQAKRRTLVVLQDEARRVMDAARDLCVAYEALVKNDMQGLQGALERIRKAEDDVENLRRSLTFELAEIGTMMMNREDILRTAYEIEEIAGYLSGIAFRFSQVRLSSIKADQLTDDIRELIDMSVEGVSKLNEAVRALTVNSSSAIEIANGVQKLEKQIDDKYRILTARVLKEVHSVSDMILLKDIVERVETMMDGCLNASDAVTICALGL